MSSDDDENFPAPTSNPYFLKLNDDDEDDFPAPPINTYVNKLISDNDETDEDDFPAPPGNPYSQNIHDENDDDIPPPPTTDITVNNSQNIQDNENQEVEKEKWDCLFTEYGTIDKDDLSGSILKVNDYQMYDSLGKGRFGYVFRASRVVGEPPYREFAIKHCNKMKLMKMKNTTRNIKGEMVFFTGEDMVQREIECMRHLFHKNVVLLFEVIDDIDDIFLVIEYMSGGVIMEYLQDPYEPTIEGKFIYKKSNDGKGPIPEDIAITYFQDLARGLAYIHSKNIVHRDIKPENLLLSSDGSKLLITDFSCALKFDDENPEGLVHDTAGSMAFQAPESCSGNEYSAYPTDVWAAGTCLFCFLVGKTPFWAEGLEPLFNSIMNDKPRYPRTGISEGARKVMELLLDKDPIKRPKAENILNLEWCYYESDDTDDEKIKTNNNDNSP